VGGGGARKGKLTLGQWMDGDGRMMQQRKEIYYIRIDKIINAKFNYS
jgi:hypothetical protein